MCEHNRRRRLQVEVQLFLIVRLYAAVFRLTRCVSCRLSSLCPRCPRWSRRGRRWWDRLAVLSSPASPTSAFLQVSQEKVTRRVG